MAGGQTESEDDPVVIYQNKRRPRAESEELRLSPKKSKKNEGQKDKDMVQLNDVEDIDKRVASGVKPLPCGEYKWDSKGLRSHDKLDQKTIELVNKWLTAKLELSAIEGGKKYYEKNWKCVICHKLGLTTRGTRNTGLEFRALINHILNVHLVKNKEDMKQKLYPCDKCQRKYLNKRTLTKHKTHRHPENSEKLFKCKSCFQTFTCCSTYEYHLLTHSKEANFRCSECGSLHKNGNSLTLHIRTFHKQETGLGNTCPHCSSVFKNLWSREAHIVDKHAEKLDWLVEKEKMDTKLTKSISSTQELDLADIIGTKHKNICSYCGIYYARNASLSFHLRKLHGIQRPKRLQVPCRFCKELFRNTRESQIHVFHKHSEQLHWFQVGVCKVSHQTLHNFGREIWQ